MHPRMENLESLVLEILKRRLSSTGFTHQNMIKSPCLRMLSLWSYLCYMATMFVYLPMGKLEQERHLQWRVLRITGGVNYRTLEELIKIAKERKETFKFDISVSVLEVYNEQIRDLLATSPSSKKQEIKQAPEGSHHIPGIMEAKVENIKEVWNVLQAGSSARAVRSSNVNEHNSRSHYMLCIMVKSNNLMNGECTKSKLWLVDLAGSERLAKTDVQGDKLKEAQNINRSLSALEDVFSALANKSNHIPYRNSKLTHLLQDSLGGDSKTLMFVQISPLDQDSSETISSLNFATRVRGVELVLQESKLIQPSYRKLN